MAAFKLKRILVAGGGGFLGINLCRALLEDGHEVVCVDNFSSGSRRNLEYLASFKRLSVFEHDVTEPFSASVDEIYNLACVASPVQYQKDPIQVLSTSTDGISNLLKLAMAKHARVFQASTSEIYGNPQTHPQTEDYFGNVNPVGPRACYDEGKRCAETLCMDYHRVHRIDVKIARIFNTYGPHMQPHDGRVISNFIVQALLGRPLTINGDGSQTRSFCYVDDMIRGIRTLMDSPRAVVGPVNIGNPGEFTILELANQILELTGSSSKITFATLPKDDPLQRRPDINRAKRLLKWQPRVQLKEGLEQTIEYFDQLLRRSPSIDETVNAANLANLVAAKKRSDSAREATL